MSFSVSKVKKTKSQEKSFNKYHKKASNLLKEYEGHVTISDEPTCHLFIGNGGMLCGISRENVLSLFNQYGKIAFLVLLPKKSYSLLSFKNIDSAKHACEEMDGYVSEGESGTPVAPFYVRYLQTKSLDFARDDVICCGEEYPKEYEANLISGLILRTDFIEWSYEERLYNYFHDRCMQQNVGENALKHRSVLHFGYKFVYGSNSIDRGHPLEQRIPHICQPIIENMLEEGLIDFHPDQLTVNQYIPGQGIPPHIDTHSAFEDGIISLSLNSQVTMDFCGADGKLKPVLLPRRSLIVMKGESRYLWSHGITPRKFDIVYTKDTDNENVLNNGNPDHLTIRERGIRISLTFRKILHKPCTCVYPSKCDSQNSNPTEKSWHVPASQNEASNLEGELVYKVYEEIAEHFSDTRHSPWPRVKHFLCNLPNGSLVADVGCGNGKYLGMNSNVVMLGSDRSFNLSTICQDRGHQVIVSDCLRLPYRSGMFDACICIAVIHHLSTSARRVDAIRELTRIVRTTGRILIYVWALEQDSGEEERCTNTPSCDSTNIKQETSSDISEKNGQLCGSNTEQSVEGQHCIQVCEGRNKFQQQDLLVPWHLKTNKSKTTKDGDVQLEKEKVFHRFYHVFKAGELTELCSQVQNVIIEEIYLDRGNWCAILKKL